MKSNEKLWVHKYDRVRALALYAACTNYVVTILIDVEATRQTKNIYENELHSSHLVTLRKMLKFAGSFNGRSCNERKKGTAIP